MTPDAKPGYKNALHVPHLREPVSLMNISRPLALLSAGSVLVLSTLACRSDVVPRDDALANDSTISRLVLGATGDAPLKLLGTELPADDESLAIALEPAALPTPLPTIPAARPAEAPVRRVARSQANPALATKRSIRKTQPAPRKLRTVVARNSTRAVAGKAWLVIPAGTEIELRAEQRVCSNTAMPGDLFATTVSEPLVMAGGTIIPDGVSARAEVISTGAPGKQDLGVRLRSVLIGGRTYPVTSRVTYAQLKKVRSRDGGARCLNDGGRLIAEFIEPLRLAL
jgi:hypothetical protein